MKMRIYIRLNRQTLCPHLADYTYLGLNQIVQVDSPQPD